MATYDQWIEGAGRQFNVDPALLRLVVMRESGGDQGAVSPKGAVGLGQLMPATAAELGVDPRDPQQNIYGAAKYLGQQLDKYGDPSLALAAYNAGPGAVDQAGGIPNYPETQNYVGSIMAKYQTNAAPKQEDAFDRDFGAILSGSAPQAQSTDAFERDFGQIIAAPAKAEPAPPAETVARVTEAPREQFLGFDVPQNLGEAVGMAANLPFDIARGGREGVRQLADAPIEWIAKGVEKSGLRDALENAGVADMLTYDEQVAANKTRRQQFSKDSNVGEAIGSVGGNVVATALPIFGAEAAIAKGGNALLSALSGSPRAMEAVQGAGRFLSGQGGLASQMTYSGLQGAAGGVLNSGASDTPLLNQMAMGAGLGATFPIAYRAATGTGNMLGPLVKPFTEKGREGIATKLTRDKALETGGVQETAIPYAPARQAPTPFTPGATTPPPGSPPASPLATSAEDILGKTSSGGRVEANFNEIIPGSKPTLAQATGNAGIAQLERTAHSGSNAAMNAFTERELANNAARLDFFNGMKGSADDITTAAAQREQQAIPLLKQAFTDAKEADAAPVVTKIDEILAGPEGKRKAVVNALNDAKDSLKNAAGDLETDVNMLYGARKSINDQLENVSGRDNTAAQLASKELIAVRDQLDEAIEGAAPGFKEYLKQYSEMSKPIGAMNYLQKLDLTDQSSQRITLAKVKSAIQKIEREQKKPGANDAKAITPEQMDGLYRLQADLQREANSLRGKAKGSDTFQHLQQNALLEAMLGKVQGKALTTAPAVAGSALGYMLGGGVGSGVGLALGTQLGSGIGKAVASQSPAVEQNLLNLLLNPERAGILEALRRRSVNPLAEDLLLRGRGSAAAAGQLTGQGSVGQ